MSEPVYLPIAQVVSLTGFTRRGVEMSIKSGRIQARQVPSKKQKGKWTKEVALASLPIEVQNIYWDKVSASAQVETEKPAGNEEAERPVEPRREGPASSLAWYHSLSEEHRARVDHKLDVIDSINAALESIEGPKTKATAELCAKHNITTVKYYRWSAAYRDKGLPGLADKRFGQSRSKLGKEQRDYIAALIKQNPDRRDTAIWRYLNQQFPEIPVSGTTVARAVKHWKQSNHELFTFLQNPDAWKSKYLLAFGSASEKATHFCEYWEVDSTPADVMCYDGRHAIIGLIDIYSRKVQLVVHPKSNSAGIAAVLRRGIVEWGVPKIIVRDNGMDYTSKHFESICSSLEIKTHTLPPFTPEGKPHIERFFRTLATSFFEELEGYIGHCVADRKAIESRRSFAQRFMKYGQEVEVQMTAAELQTAIDRWTNSIYHKEPHRGINDTPEHRAAQSPQAVRQIEDIRALDICLAPVGFATVQKKGIRHNNAHYVSPALAPYVKERVQVRTEPNDASQLYVFDLENNYLCTAVDSRLAGITDAQYRETRKVQRKLVEAQKRAIDALTHDPMERRLQLAEKENNLHAIPRKEKHKTKTLEEATAAALESVGRKPDRYKSIAEHMAESEQNETPETFDDLDDFDYFDDVDIVNL